MITNEDVKRFHAAARIIEIDGTEGYFSCCERFGSEIAGMALVAWLRAKNGTDYWPREELIDEVNKILREEGRLETG